MILSLRLNTSIASDDLYGLVSLGCTPIFPLQGDELPTDTPPPPKQSPSPPSRVRMMRFETLYLTELGD